MLKYVLKFIKLYNIIVKDNNRMKRFIFQAFMKRFIFQAFMKRFSLKAVKSHVQI